MPLHFVTGNSGKFEEVQSLIADIQQVDFDLDEIQEIDPHKVIQHKLLQAAQHQEGDLIIEDTSLYFEGLNGLPGPFIKWFHKSLKNEGLATLCKKTGNTTAVAKTIIGYIKKGQAPQYFEGAIVGEIVTPRGEFGFGWDSIFLPNGSQKTFGEMTMAEKSQYSARKIAVLKLKEFLATAANS